MVYYEEINYISIVSIILTILSILTKSLIFIQGMDCKTLLFTYLCFITDFIGVYFVISWIFYSNQLLLLKLKYSIFTLDWNIIYLL